MKKIDPTTGVGVCSIGSGRVWGDWLLQWGLATSANHGRGTCGQTIVPFFKVSTLGPKKASGLELQVVKGGTLGCIRNRVTGTTTLLVLLSSEKSPSMTVVAIVAVAMPLIT